MIIMIASLRDKPLAQNMEALRPRYKSTGLRRIEAGIYPAELEDAQGLEIRTLGAEKESRNGIMNGYTCNVCGQYHEGLPLSYGSAEPALVYSIPENERKKRVFLSSDQCEVRGKNLFAESAYFIVGNIDIPIIDSTEIFRWTVWVSLSKDNYKRASKLWNKSGREKEHPYLGWLSTSLPLYLYPETLNLKTNVHTRPLGMRPFVELEPTGHPLAMEQKSGINWKRVQEIAELVLHPKQPLLCT